MNDTMNIMQFMYKNERAQKIAMEEKLSYRKVMALAIHDLFCEGIEENYPIKFRVINGEPFAEWVEHTEDEWINILDEMAERNAARRLAQKLEDALNKAFGEMFGKTDDDNA